MQLRGSHAVPIVQDSDLPVLDLDVDFFGIGIPRIGYDLSHNCRGTTVETDPKMIQDVQINFKLELCGFRFFDFFN
ncbi:hypothetical protein MASR1M60_29380 [Rhodocyclaceae bacterium]